MTDYKTVLLDIDQTILDFNTAETISLTEALDSFGIKADRTVISTYHEINDRLWKDFELGTVTKDELKILRFERTLKKCNIKLDADKLQKKYTDCLSEQGILLDGAREFLDSLFLTAELYAVTNGISYVQKGRFAKADINKYFKGVFISEDVGVGKPDKRYFEYVLSKVNEKDKSRIIVVGDSLTSDIKGGLSVGLDTILYDVTKTKKADGIIPKYVASSYGEILDIIKQK